MDDAAITGDEARAILSKDMLEDSTTPATDTYGSFKSSFELLSMAQPAEDITAKVGKPHETKPPKATPEDAKIETVFEKLKVTDKTDSNVTSKLADPQNLTEQQKSSALFKEDNIFSNEVHNPCSASIYSVNGTPSTRINRRRTTSSHVFPAGCMGCKEEVIELHDRTSSTRKFLDAKEATDCTGQIENMPKKRASSATLDPQRNPVTGTGVQDILETRRPAIRRKDGNPLLGLGYEESSASLSSNPGNPNRVPPGGYSHGLW